MVHLHRSVLYLACLDLVELFCMFLCSWFCLSVSVLATSSISRGENATVESQYDNEGTATTDLINMWCIVAWVVLCPIVYCTALIPKLLYTINSKLTHTINLYLVRPDLFFAHSDWVIANKYFHHYFTHSQTLSK